MNSTDQNLNNPTKSDQLHMFREIPANAFMNIVPVTQDLYDHIANPDPHTCYAIIDSPLGRMYYGSIPIMPNPESMRPKYFITQNEKGEWVVYLNSPYRDGFRTCDRMLEILRYDNKDINKAISAMNLYNKIGSHASIDIDVYNTLMSYINGDTNLNDTILGIIIIFGYGNSSEFQTLLQVIQNMTVDINKHLEGVDLRYPKPGILDPLHEEMARRANENEMSLFALYNRIYNVIIADKLFKKAIEISDPEKVDLSDVIERITRAFVEWRCNSHV